MTRKQRVTRRQPTKRIPNVGDRIIASLTELRDALHAGVPLASRFTVRTVSVADPDPFDARRVRVLRGKVGVSQAVFAKLVGVSTVLAQSWEQGRREPSPLARRLLTEIERDPVRWQRMIAITNDTRPARRTA